MGKFGSGCKCEKIKEYSRIKMLCQFSKNDLKTAKTTSNLMEMKYERILNNCSETFDMTEAADLYAAMKQLNDKGNEELDGAIDRLDKTISSLKDDIEELEKIDTEYHAKHG
ncbi:hypothetical protein [Butyrivibrio sp. XBB1001]|uniref:hypothetical protein n=1 Tax=Butyrivibrio sp. XBB1001 TaxID=1280682 RepID=UPI00047944C6|nr:hypothetical protein [Butyrivibrio sp. XBB1001]